MTYRYRLDRNLGTTLLDGSSERLLWIMLNPSTADEILDDPTICRVKGFTTRLGFSRLTVVNLYAWRATSPADLWHADDPVGIENDRIIRDLVKRSAYCETPIIAAWGANARPDRVDQVLRIIRDVRAMARLHCLGVTAADAPRHPLYLRADSPLTPWPTRADA